MPPRAKKNQPFMGSIAMFVCGQHKEWNTLASTKGSGRTEIATRILTEVFSNPTARGYMLTDMKHPDPDIDSALPNMDADEFAETFVGIFMSNCNQVQVHVVLADEVGLTKGQRESREKKLRHEMGETAYAQRIADREQQRAALVPGYTLAAMLNGVSQALGEDMQTVNNLDFLITQHELLEEVLRGESDIIDTMLASKEEDICEYDGLLFWCFTEVYERARDIDKANPTGKQILDAVDEIFLEGLPDQEWKDYYKINFPQSMRQIHEENHDEAKHKEVIDLVSETEDNNGEESEDEEDVSRATKPFREPPRNPVLHPPIFKEEMVKTEDDNNGATNPGPKQPRASPRKPRRAGHTPVINDNPDTQRIAELERANIRLQAEVKDRDGQIRRLKEEADGQIRRLKEELASIKLDRDGRIHRLEEELASIKLDS